MSTRVERRHARHRHRVTALTIAGLGAAALLTYAFIATDPDTTPTLQANAAQPSTTSQPAAKPTTTTRPQPQPAPTTVTTPPITKVFTTPTSTTRPPAVILRNPAEPTTTTTPIDTTQPLIPDPAAPELPPPDPPPLEPEPEPEPQPEPPAALAACTAYQGIYGNDNQTMGTWPTILWTCNNWTYTTTSPDGGDLNTRFQQLGVVCLAGGGTGYALKSDDAEMHAWFTCGSNP